MGSGLEDRGLDAGRLGAVERLYPGLAARDGDDLDALPAVDRVDDRLEIGSRSGDENGDRVLVAQDYARTTASSSNACLPFAWRSVPSIG
jgi:hypothetical protein